MSKKSGEWDQAAEASVQSEAERYAAAFPPEAFTERLPVALTEREQIEKGKELDQALEVEKALEAEKKRAAADFRLREELAGAHVEQLRKIVRTGEEVREVECQKRFNRGEGTVTCVRLDTFETFHERPMSDEEKNPPMPGFGVPKLEKGAKKSKVRVIPDEGPAGFFDGVDGIDTPDSSRDGASDDGG